MALWMVLMSVVTAALDKLYESLIERGLSLAESEYSLATGVKAEIEKLWRTTERIQALLTDADERRYIEDESVHLWLRHLKDVGFDADDLLDDYQTDLNTSKLRTDRKRKRSWHYRFLPSLTADPILLKRRRMSKRIAEIRDRLDHIHKERGSLRLRDGDARRRIPARGDPPVPQAGSLQDVLKIRGRDSDVAHIVELLKLDGKNDAPVLSLVGMAGLGKTTLAGLVFEDGRIVKHFKLRIWVSLSEAVDPAVVTREIIEAIDKNKYDPPSLNLLQHRLADLVRKRRFLLVLDNVMNEEPRFWETVRVPLLAGADGSKVLITTRSMKVANAMSQVRPIALQGLGFDDCLFLFKERAFEQGQNEVPQNLADIGEKIVKRCQGSPLAAKSLGGILYNVTDEDEWESVLKEMWEQEEKENHILSVLKVSYNHLPLHLKQCFRYCSIFPDGYEFDKDELVKLWMAEGFIQPRGRRRLEIIGGKYFDDLLWRSFFQNSEIYDQSKQKYKMPSLIHDLAQSVSIYECLRMEHQADHSESRNPRYASISHRYIDAEVFSELCAYENLRTLLLYSEWNMPWKQALRGFFAKFRCLRTLDLGNSIMEELPNSIGDLKHLRYISLRNTQIRGLPESICSLYNLQTLELSECYELLKLPDSMSNLVSLRHLGLHIDWDRGTDLISMPPGIGRLTNLQTLSRFTVTSGSGSGSGIGELKDLNLRGELCISKLENVVTVRDAKEANLNQKQYIEVLMLKWSAITHISAQGGTNEEIIGKLRPHPKLRNLWMENYNGTDFPSWIGDPSFTCLESLTLSSCKKCRILPQLGQLPKLKNLCIKGMDQLESMPGLPPALEKLELRNCRGLTPPPVLHSLRDLAVEDGNEVTLRWITKLTTLSSLTISRFRKLKCASGSCFQSLTALKSLKIEKCNKLVSLAEKRGLQNLTSLDSLEILSCPELAYLPGGLHLLRSLHRLEIRAVPKLTSIPVEGLPVGLEKLVINGCPLLEQRCDEDGVDWPKIKHIPVLNIGS